MLSLGWMVCRLLTSRFYSSFWASGLLSTTSVCKLEKVWGFLNVLMIVWRFLMVKFMVLRLRSVREDFWLVLKIFAISASSSSALSKSARDFEVFSINFNELVVLMVIVYVLRLSDFGIWVLNVFFVSVVNLVLSNALFRKFVFIKFGYAARKLLSVLMFFVFLILYCMNLIVVMFNFCVLIVNRLLLKYVWVFFLLSFTSFIFSVFTFVRDVKFAFTARNFFVLMVYFVKFSCFNGYGDFKNFFSVFVLVVLSVLFVKLSVSSVVFSFVSLNVVAYFIVFNFLFFFNCSLCIVYCVMYFFNVCLCLFCMFLYFKLSFFSVVSCVAFRSVVFSAFFVLLFLLFLNVLFFMYIDLMDVFIVKYVVYVCVVGVFMWCFEV